MPRLLLCPPDHYGIEYEINPWMHRERNADIALAREQWNGLHQKLLALGAEVELLRPQPRLPDMVFTANAGLLVGNKFVLSHFRHAERQGEEEHFATWFGQRDFEVIKFPDGEFFEGEGDALFCGDVLFCGYKFRSDIRAHRRIGELFSCLVVSVELVDGRFYHLDTCFCPLPDGSAVWYPGAFDTYAQRAIAEHVTRLIAVPESEAIRFACNAVVLGEAIVLPDGCPTLCGELRKLGHVPHELPMSEFLKAGGACKCLTLFLPQRTA